jgi:N-acetylglutamate synthase-like GNAT family acetyltransferase
MSSGIIRRAAGGDERAIDDLVSKVGRVVLQVLWSDVPSLLRTYDFFLIEGEGRLGCVWGSLVGPDTVAKIRVFALLDDWSTRETLAALLPLARSVLREKGVETLAFVGMEGWLLEGLVANGFRRMNTILTLQKTDWRVPDPGNLQVVVRPASSADLASILAIDESAFEPLWRNTAETLATCLEECPHFVVAELNGETVGYQYLSLVGRHGHLSRVAVHPKYQGQRIGARLLVEAVRFFRRRRVFGMTLNTQQNNWQARRLYERFGFKVMGKEALALVCDV